MHRYYYMFKNVFNKILFSPILKLLIDQIHIKLDSNSFQSLFTYDIGKVFVLMLQLKEEYIK